MLPSSREKSTCCTWTRNGPAVGELGSDTLLGGDGSDSLSGGSEADTLTGGAGDDTFQWVVADGDSTVAAQDQVTAFEGAGAAGGDTLLLQAFPGNRRFVFEGARPAMPALGAAIGFGGNGFTEVFYAPDGADTVVFADTNDDGVLDAGDFAEIGRAHV